MRYNQTVDFKSITETKDSGGSLVTTETTVLNDYPCLIDQVGEDERMLLESRGYFDINIIYCNYHPIINSNMVVNWGGNDYSVQRVRNPNYLNRKLEIVIYRHA